MTFILFNCEGWLSQFQTYFNWWQLPDFSFKKYFGNKCIYHHDHKYWKKNCFWSKLRNVCSHYSWQLVHSFMILTRISSKPLPPKHVKWKILVFEMSSCYSIIYASCEDKDSCHLILHFSENCLWLKTPLLLVSWCWKWI